MMNAISKKSMKNPEDEDRQVRRDQEADHAARQVGQQIFDPHVAVDATEHERERRRADEDEHDHRRQSSRFLHRPAQRRARQAAVDRGENHRAHRSERTRLGGCRDAGEDAAKHEQDQQQRRQEDLANRADERADASIAFSLGQGWRNPWLHEGDHADVECEQSRQPEPGDERADEQVANADTELIGEDDQHDARWGRFDRACPRPRSRPSRACPSNRSGA